MSKVYQISSKTIKDIFANIPREKRLECFDELRQMVENMNASESAQKIIELTAKKIDPSAELTPFVDSIPDVFDWVDDGKGEVVAVTSINGVDVMSVGK